MFLGKSAQDDEDKGDVFRSLARERKSERVCVAIEPSGTIFGKFSWSPGEEGTMYRALTGGKESERGYATPRGVCMSIKGKGLPVQGFA